jgi:hypothetical protein
MPTAQQVTNEVQERLLETVKVGQKGLVDFVRSWAQTVEATFSKLPDLSFPESTLKPTEAFEQAFGFTEKFLASQREFANQLFEAALPATRAPAGAAQGTAQTARAAAGVPKN